MGALEWESRSAYALTEFVVFALGALIFAAMLVSLGLLFCFFRNSKHLNIVQKLHRFMIRTIFTNANDLTEILYPAEKKKTERPKVYSTWGKVVIYIYFTILCALVALWYLAVFSDSVLYRKTGTCNDLNVNDTDYSCFLISDRNVPPEVQRIIDEEAGELVPCQQIRDYLMTSNVTFNLEVICYSSQFNPIISLGVAYGAVKTIVFLLQVTFKGFLFLASRGIWVKRVLLAIQTGFVSLVVLFILIVPVSLHELSGPRNTPLDFLRGERFYPYAVICLLGLSTVLIVGLTPWWAFEPVTLRELFCCGRGTMSDGNHEHEPDEMYNKTDLEADNEEDL